MRIAPWVVVGVSLLAASAARAAGPDVHELRHDVAIDAAVAVTATALVVGSELGKADLSPDRCRWCDRDAQGQDDLDAPDRAARSALRWDDTRLAARISDGLGFVGAPLTAFGTLFVAASHDGGRKGYALDALLLYETVAIAAVTNQIVKFTVARERPFAHARGNSPEPRTARKADENLSFYSGHTSLTFTLAAAAGTLAHLRGYRLAPLVWAAGLPIAGTAGYLRIAADKHYLSDVLVGAVVGTAIGILVPIAFHGRRDEASGSIAPGTVAAPLGSPSMVTLGGAF